MNSAEGLGLIHDDLLQQLSANAVRCDLRLGKVFDEKGRQFKEWHTLRACHFVIVRGSKRGGYRVAKRKMVHDPKLPGYRVCNVCGRIHYYAEGKRYLYPEPPADADIFESHLAGLVFRSHLLEHIDLKKYRKLIVDRLPILDPPPDGLGVLQCE